MDDGTEGTEGDESPRRRRRRKAAKPADGKGAGGRKATKLRAGVKPITHRRIRGYAILVGTSVGALIDQWTAEKTRGMRFAIDGGLSGSGELEGDEPGEADG